MARIRTIKPEFFRHEGLFDAEQDTGLPLRVAYAGLWTAADREGRFKWRPRQLKLDALPLDDVDFSRVLDALTTRGFVMRYRVNDEEFGLIPAWNKHQVINNREAASQIPAPTEEVIKSAASTRASRVDDACPTPLVHAQAERKGREGKGIEKSAAGAAALSEDFKGSLFRRWKELPNGGGGAFLNKLFRDYKPEQLVLESVERTLDETRADPKAFVIGILKSGKGVGYVHAIGMDVDDFATPSKRERDRWDEERQSCNLPSVQRTPVLAA